MAMVEMQSVVPAPGRLMMPAPPSAPRPPLQPPEKMARPTIAILNSYAVDIHWTPPADLHSRRTRLKQQVSSRPTTMQSRPGTQQAPRQAPPDHPVAGYRLRYQTWKHSEEDDDEANIRTIRPVVCEGHFDYEQSSAQLEWLRGGMDYVFQIMAFNDAGEGPWSDPTDIFPMPESQEPVYEPVYAPIQNASPKRAGLARPQSPPGRTSPTSPRVLSAVTPKYVSRYSDRIEIKWPTPCDRGSNILFYDLQCSKNPSFPDKETRQMKANGMSASFIVDKLAPNSTYYFRNRAHNAQGASPWSDPSPGIVTTAIEPARPEPPQRLGEQTSPSEIHIKWIAPESSLPITHYAVRGSKIDSMDQPFDVPIGGDGGMASPQMRRPGFTKGSFAVTQLKARGLDPATTYYFQVRAFNQVAPSEWSMTSGPMRTLVSPPPRCGKPTLVEGRARDGMRLRWRAPEGPGEKPSRYDVCVADNAIMMNGQDVRDVEIVLVDASSGTEFVDVLVKANQVTFIPGKLYFFRSRGANSAGPGEWSPSSDPLEVSPETPSRPEAPSNFVPMPAGMIVRWNAPDCQGSPILGYRLRYSTARNMTNLTEAPNVGPCPFTLFRAEVHAKVAQEHKGKSENELGKVYSELWARVPVGEKERYAREAASKRAVTTEYHVSPLRPNETYFFQVCAFNAVGDSEWSPPSGPALSAVSKPAQLSRPTLLTQTPSSITIGFTPPCDIGARNQNTVQTYVVRYVEEGAVETRPPYLEEGDPMMKGPLSPLGEVSLTRFGGIEVTGLKPGVRYAFWVVSINAAGEGEPSDLSHFATSPSAPDRPLAPELVEEDCSAWSLAIRLHPTAGNGAQVTHFALEVEDCLNNKIWRTANWDAEPSTEDGMFYNTVLHLHPGIDYNLRALAINAIGESEWSEVLKGCRCNSLPPYPVNLTLEEVQSRTFTVKWEPPFHNGEEITDYILQWSKDDEFRVGHIFELRTTETKGSGGDLMPGIQYFARACAANSEGFGKYGPVLRMDTKPAEPLAPSGARCGRVGHIHARIDWIIPFSCGSEINGFRVRYTETETDGRPWGERDIGVYIVDGKKRSCIVEPLRAGREYTFEVAARNPCGWGPYSAPSSASRVLPALLPTEPGEPSVLDQETEALNLGWDASDGIGADVIEQVVQVSVDPEFPEGQTMEVILPPWSPDWPFGAVMRPVDDQSTKAQPTPGVNSRPTTVGTAQWSPLNSALNTSTGFHPSAPAGAAAQPDPAAAPAPAADGAGPPPAQQQQQLQEQQPQQAAPVQQPARKADEEHVDPRQGAWPVGCEPLGTDETLPHTRWVRAPGYSKWGVYRIPNLQPGTFYHFRVASRSEAGLGPFGPVSQPIATAVREPEPPVDVQLLVAGSRGLAVGWAPPRCWGDPVTHYVVRYAETEEGLSAEDCLEIRRVEYQRETWPGIVKPEPLPESSQEEQDFEAACQAEGSTEATLSFFAQHLVVRFSSLELAFEFLDVHHTGRIDKLTFAQGDPTAGIPSFPDLEGDFVDKVWDSLGASDGEVTWEHIDKLRPYAERVLSGQLIRTPFPRPEGVLQEGPWCLIPDLFPGKLYFVEVRAINTFGTSEWAPCVAGALTTAPEAPDKMEPPEGVPEHRTVKNLALRWQLPEMYTLDVTQLQIRWLHQDAGVPAPEKRVVTGEGTLIEVFPNEATGKLPAHWHLTGFKAGQAVFASVRAFSKCGGGRRWSELTSTLRPCDEAPWKHHCCTLSLPPEMPEMPSFVASSLSSKDFEVAGHLCVKVNRNNGPPFQALGFEVVDCLGEPRDVAYKLYATVVRARGVAPFGAVSADPFVTVNVPGRDPLLGITTRTIYNTRTPEWNYRQQLRGWDLEQQVEFQVWNQEFGEAPTPLGRIVLDGSPRAEEELLLLDNANHENLQGFITVKLEVEEYAPERRVAAAWEADVPEGNGYSAMISPEGVLRSVPGIKPGEYYKLRARSITEDGTSEWTGVSIPMRMPADVPSVPPQLVCEFTAVTWVELMWSPPHGNGDDDFVYEIRAAASEDAPEEEWEIFGVDAVTAGMKKSTALGTVGNWLFRVFNMKPGTARFFSHRARNGVGWSIWSPASRFVTRATRPSKLPAGGLRLVDMAPDRLHIKWVEPRLNGSEVARYDLIGGPSIRVLHWAHMATLLLERTMDADKLFNVNSFFGLEFGEVVGQDCFSEFFCETCMYSPLTGDTRSLDLPNLLPGQTYHFMLRAVCKEGKGDFSDIVSVRMSCHIPYPGQPGFIGHLTDFEARFFCWLPYNNGSPIDTIRIECHWVSGPLAEDQMDPLTQRPIEEEHTLLSFESNLQGFSHFSKLGLEREAFEARRSSIRAWVWGTTEAVLDMYRAEDIDHIACDDGHVPCLQEATSKVYSTMFEGLLPGTTYSIIWKSHNAMGWSKFSEPTLFTTSSVAPDKPLLLGL